MIKHVVAYASLLAGIGISVLGFFVPYAYLQSFLASLGSSFIALAVGVIFVNIYLERKSRRSAVKSVLVLANDSIASFHNHFITVCWDEYGKDQWVATQKEYLKSNGDPNAIKKQVREFLYNIYTQDIFLKQTIDELEDTLVELSRLVGWDLDSRILQSSLNARSAIIRVNKRQPDNSSETIDYIAEHLLDIDMSSQKCRQLLVELAGVNE